MASVLCVLFEVLLSHLNIVESALPISYPDNWKSTFGEPPYNMIETDPNCYYGGFCPFFYPGGEWSAFPNSEEKASMILQQMYRMWGNESLNLTWGKWLYGANTAVRAFYHYKQPCGTTSDSRTPLHWYSDANTAARFKQYDENSCDQKWYKEDGMSAHSTCGWVLPEYQEYGDDHCDYFSTDSNTADSVRCSWGYRSGTFCEQDNCWFYSENICGTNSCIKDGHCEPIFSTAIDYIGSGFHPGMNGAAHVYSRFTDEIHRYMPLGAHFDERIKIGPDDYNAEGKHLTLMTEWWDEWRNQTLEACWALYGGEYTVMEVGVSTNGDWNTGYSIDSYSSLLVQWFDPPEQTCEPYAFICKTQEDNYYRLPEEDIYYFGTEWLDWVWTDYEGDYNLHCKENHYYNDGDRWIVNGGPNLDRCDIWYYTNTNYSECLGCSKIAKLECWEACIRSGFQSSSCNCDNIDDNKEDYPYEWCPPTLAPSAAPTTKTALPTVPPTTSAPTTAAPSKSPTLRPTVSPTSPTKSPTEEPSQSPTPRPTTSPTSPTKSPTDRPTKCPTCTHDPTKEPTSDPTYDPTSDPTQKPSSDPTGSPSKLPTPPTAKPTKSPTTVVSVWGPTPAPLEGRAEEAVVEEDKSSMAAGAIVAIVIAGLLCIVCFLAYFYWRIKDGKPLYPTRDELRVITLPQTPMERAKKDESNMSKQLSEDMYGRQQSVHEVADTGDFEGVATTAVAEAGGLPPALPEEQNAARKSVYETAANQGNYETAGNGNVEYDEEYEYYYEDEEEPANPETDQLQNEQDRDDSNGLEI